MPAVPAVPAMSRNSSSVVDNPVLLEIVEDNTWFNELESGPDPVGTGEQTAVRDQPKHSPSVSPVLKVTGGTKRQNCTT